MNTVFTISLIHVCAAVLLVAISVPLILGKIPMNHYYGARFKASFSSEANWYAINRYGAKCLAFACIPILIHGLLGLVFHEKLENWYLWVGLVDALGCLGFAVFAAHSKAVEISSSQKTA